MFDKKLEIDVFTVLLLLGEASIWKAIWGRFRSSRSATDWRHWIFAVSPGWAPLALTIFSTINGSDGPPNLIFDKPPPEAVDTGLMLTHLSSGATHPATNPVLQNIWNTWKKAPRRARRELTAIKGYNTSKETGFVDVEIDALQLHNYFGLACQIVGLATQFLLSGFMGAFAKGFGYEPIVALCVAFIAQILLIFAVTPRKEAWDPKSSLATAACPIMLHRGLESTSVLIIRAASHRGNQIVLEKFCGETMAMRNEYDVIQLICALFSCIALILHIILVSWMSDNNKLLYFGTGLIGLVVTALEGASEPNWKSAYQEAFTGIHICSPLQSGLMATVAVLIAGRFAAGEQAAKLLYPSNAIFDDTRQDLTNLFGGALCATCRKKINPEKDSMSEHAWKQYPHCSKRPRPCVENLVEELNNTPDDRENSQKRDAICAVYHCIRLFAPHQCRYLPSELRSSTQTQITLGPAHMTHQWAPTVLNIQRPPPVAGVP